MLFNKGYLEPSPNIERDRDDAQQLARADPEHEQAPWTSAARLKTDSNLLKGGRAGLSGRRAQRGRPRGPAPRSALKNGKASD